MIHSFMTVNSRWPTSAPEQTGVLRFVAQACKIRTKRGPAKVVERRRKGATGGPGNDVLQ